MNEVTLEERMQRLERQNRWLKVGVVAVLAAVAGFVCIAATRPADRVVRAERFEVADSKGKARAILVCGEDGPGLTLYDEEGNKRATLSVSADGDPALVLADEKGTWRFTLEVSDDGPGLAFCDEKGKRRVVLGVSSDSGPVLQLRDDKGWVRAALGAYSLMTPDTGKVAKRAESSLVLFDKESKVLWKAP